MNQFTSLSLLLLSSVHLWQATGVYSGSSLGASEAVGSGEVCRTIAWWWWEKQ